MTDGVHIRDANAAPALAQSEAVKMMKPLLLVKVIEDLNMEQALIFCRTNLDCNNLEQFLTGLGGGRSFRGQMESGKEGKCVAVARHASMSRPSARSEARLTRCAAAVARYSCCVLAGMRSMEDRRRNLHAFKEGHVRFLICTDVAARGIDISELPYVVNMTLPDVTENYIHRIGADPKSVPHRCFRIQGGLRVCQCAVCTTGRVGRADKMGLAISIVSPVKEKVWYHTCNKRRGIGCSNTKLKDKGGCTIWFVVRRSAGWITPCSRLCAQVRRTKRASPRREAAGASCGASCFGQVKWPSPVAAVDARYCVRGLVVPAQRCLRNDAFATQVWPSSRASYGHQQTCRVHSWCSG